eukprot:15203319-Alexandrium_andersonii.AAC.1
MPSRGAAQPSDGAEPQLGLAGLQMTTAVARGRVVFRLFGGARGDPWPTHGAGWRPPPRRAPVGQGNSSWALSRCR